MDLQQLQEKSSLYRKKLIELIYHAKAGHTGGCLSIVDLLNVLYNHVLRIEDPKDPMRDRYIQSKGHAVEALYVVLADQGFFNENDLLTLGQYGSPYIGHPTKKIPGMEQNTGGLGHGLSIAAGTALAAKKDNKDIKVYSILGDGEMAEGSNWEAMMFCAHYGLDNLCAILDYNKLQITGPNAKVMGLEPIKEKIASFGWAVNEVDGHDIAALVQLFDSMPFEQGKPNFIIAHTIKGKGVSYMENQIKWHHGVPNEDQFKQAMEELSL